MEPDNKPEEPQTKTIDETLDAVVEMMNKGELSSESVYPRGRYQGD